MLERLETLLSEEFTTHKTRRIQARELDGQGRARKEPDTAIEHSYYISATERSTHNNGADTRACHQDYRRNASVAAAKRAITANVSGAMADLVCAAALKGEASGLPGRGVLSVLGGG